MHNIAPVGSFQKDEIEPQVKRVEGGQAKTGTALVWVRLSCGTANTVSLNPLTMSFIQKSATVMIMEGFT